MDGERGVREKATVSLRNLVIAGLGLGALSAIAVYFYHFEGGVFFNRYMAVLMLAIGLFSLGRGLRKWRLSRKAKEVKGE